MKNMEEEYKIQIKDLAVQYHTDMGVAKAVNRIDLGIRRGEAVGLVGESGSGKTTTALSILRLLPKPAGKMISGSIKYDGVELTVLPEKKMRAIRGDKISMIFQNPLTSLNPVFTIREQIAMVFLQHSKMTNSQAVKQAGDMLEKVGIPRSRLSEYPHQFSGGMRQRVGIAAGLACTPGLLIADEPTTALDVTIQLQVLELIKKLQKEYGTSLLMITHNLGIIAELCTQVAVMYAGTIVEKGPVQEVFISPRHPYTIGLLGSLPKLTGQRDRLTAIGGSAASSNQLPSGCVFHPRCPQCTDLCRRKVPLMTKMTGERAIACHLYAKEVQKLD